jgi:DNA (cytosine-5)-methyltransferase 3A
MAMNILSLFDGMSCGQQALERAGIEVDNYFASEIDKYAIQVTMANYPDTKQLGSVVNVNGFDLPKIDLLIGGSPCQSFSFAGKRKGMATKCETEILTLEHYLELKADGYEFEGQSYLFWEFMRLLNECKPKYFLLENVEMGEKWEKVLSKAIGVNGIHINSALVSAQNRKRIYWTNIGLEPGGLFGDLVSIIQKPKDKGILLKDVLESEVDEKYFLSEKMLAYLNRNTELQKHNGNGFRYKPTDGNQKGKTITSKEGSRMDDNFIKIDRQGNVKNHQDKASSLSVGGHGHGNHSDMDLIVHNTMPRSSTTGKEGTGHLSRTDGKTYCLDTGNTNAVEIVAMRGRGEKGNIEQKLEFNGIQKSNSLTTVLKDNLVIGGDYRYDEGFRWRDNNKSGTLPARGRSEGNDFSGQALAKINNRIRRLTPLECERLQTVKDNYTNHVSDSQRYKMLGNGWTVSVVSHIFSYLK